VTLATDPCPNMDHPVKGCPPWRRYTTRRECNSPEREISVTSFLAWVGGKRILAKRIVSMMPEHKTYVEVFGGAGWVLFRKEPSEVEVWNDLNGDLANLFRVVRDRLEDFRSRQYYLLSSRKEYYRFMEDIKAGKFRSRVERAIAFYYCIKNSFGSGIFTGWAFGPERGPKYCQGLDVLDLARERLKHAYIDNLSFEKLIPNWDRDGTLFYCDPPYMMLLGKAGRSYYQCEFTEEDHRRLREVLGGVKGRFILSYDDHPAVRDLYRGFNVQEAGKVNYSMNCRPGSTPRHRPEVLVTNF
jgi:DNA adenine methylase